MGKREVKKQIRAVLKKVVAENFKEYEVAKKISEVITQLEGLTQEHNIDIELDFEGLKSKTIEQCLQEDERFIDFVADVGFIIESVEEWLEDAPVSKKDFIQDEFLNPLSEVLENLEDIDWIEVHDDVVTLISNNTDVLKELLDL